MINKHQSNLASLDKEEVKREEEMAKDYDPCS